MAPGTNIVDVLLLLVGGVVVRERESGRERGRREERREKERIGKRE